MAKKESSVKKESSAKKAAGISKKESKTVTKQATSKSTRAAAPVWTTVGTAGEKIADEAYRGNESLVRVEVAEGVTEIGSEAFSGCVNLESVKIPKSVARIGYEAFRGCSKLRNVVMAEGIEEIEDRAFAVCKSLKEIAIPASVKEIGDRAFAACVGLDRISFASGETRIDEETFMWCAVIRKVEVPVGLQEGCALLASRGYKAIRKAANQNAKYGDDVELKVAKLELWSYSPTIGTAWVDSLDEVDDDLAEYALYDGVGYGGTLDVSYIGGEVRINGETADVDFDSVRRVRLGVENRWSEFRDKIGIYSVDIDKAGCTTFFAIAGDFDPEKLTLYYKTAIGPGYYYKHPERVTIALLDRVEYDGVELELDYYDERNNKGYVFTVFNKGKYANYGCDVEDLDWKKFPSDNNWDWFGAWEWAYLLSRQPQFADKCDKWDSFDAVVWATILCSQPQFADKCDKWDSFSEWVWKCILRSQPQFADKCDKWKWFDDIDIASLASEQEAFVPKLLRRKKISPWAAAIVLAKRPDVNVDMKLLSGKVDDEAYELALEDVYPFETPWAYLLSRQPQFAGKFKEWKVLSVADWLGLLSKQPGFSSHCDWKKFEEEWDADSHTCMVTGNDELIALIRAKTGIDITEEMDFDEEKDFDTFVNNPALAKEFDSWDWGMPQAKSWSRVLSLYPDLVTQFEADVDRGDGGK